MITQDDIEVAWAADSRAGLAELTKRIALCLLQERDAYREVAIELGGHEEPIDAEAQRILEAKKEGKAMTSKPTALERFEKIKQSDDLLYDMLKASIRYHKFLYYKLDRPEISDYEYDILERRFDQIAEKLKREGSWVGWRDK